MNGKLLVITCIVLFILSGCFDKHPIPESEVQAVDSNSITDKVVAGYQGWFNAHGDGSPYNQWIHWSKGGRYNTNDGMPTSSNITFELYPDVREYSPSSLFATGFAPLGDGSPAKLFSSYPADVVNKHFSWMRDYGIDGVALQRFGSGLTSSGVTKQYRDEIAVKVKQAAEAYGRIFYVMYDISGMKEDTFVQEIKNDWTGTMTGSLSITSSSRYAKQNGKPVVCIWGLGLTGRPGTHEQTIELVNWFKERGFYVIGGVPKGWRSSNEDSKPGFQEAYKAFNMISPWTVGRFKDSTGVDNYQAKYLIPDRDYAAANGMAYQPVVFPGFAWSNWKNPPKDEISRNKGEFFWRQAYNVRASGIPGMYIAMFDEYDEGTAIAKAAEDSSMIPTDQYFLTTSANGTYISSDFYLRLAGKATRMIKGLDPAESSIPIAYTNGPVFFRTGFEEVDAKLTWSNTIDSYQQGGSRNISGIGNSTSPEIKYADYAHRGKRSILAEGKDTSTSESYIYWKAVDVNIPISANTKLSYWTHPVNDLGRYVSVDLVMTDGTTLRESGAKDQNNVNMHPKSGRGTVGQWSQTKSEIGHWLKGKTIDKILIGYENISNSGEFQTYLDDILITDEQL
jgi:hypothetical protein